MNSDASTIRLPDFVIIGAMKCATSTLHDQLKGQSGFFMSDPKEPNFFSDDDQFARGLDSYSDLFRDAPENAICGESSTHYTKLPTHPDTIERLGQAIPNARFIYLMRHPIDRLVSHYIHDWTEGTVSTSIDEAIQSHTTLVDYGRYAMQLRPWIERFGSDRVLPVFLERLKRDPQAVLEHVCRFLSHRNEPRWNDEQQQSNVSEARLRKSPFRDLIVNAPGLRQLRQALVPQSLRDKIKSRWQMRNRPVLSEASRDRLSSIFDRDLAELGRWLGTELSCATFEKTVAETDLEWSSRGGGNSP